MSDSRRTIHKYVLEIADRQTIDVPPSFDPLCVQVQDGRLCLWAEVEFDRLLHDTDTHQRIIEIYGTSNPIGDSFFSSYVGTAQMPDGLVWHVYDGGFDD